MLVREHVCWCPKHIRYHSSLAGGWVGGLCPAAPCAPGGAPWPSPAAAPSHAQQEHFQGPLEECLLWG